MLDFFKPGIKKAGVNIEYTSLDEVSIILLPVSIILEFLSPAFFLYHVSCKDINIFKYYGDYGVLV